MKGKEEEREGGVDRGEKEEKKREEEPSTKLLFTQQ